MNENKQVYLLKVDDLEEDQSDLNIYSNPKSAELACQDWINNYIDIEVNNHKNQPWIRKLRSLMQEAQESNNFGLARYWFNDQQHQARYKIQILVMPLKN